MSTWEIQKKNSSIKSRLKEIMAARNYHPLFFMYLTIEISFHDKKYNIIIWK